MTPQQLATSDLLAMKFAAGSDPALSYDQAAAVQDWPANVTRVERVISDRKNALVGIRSPEAVMGASGTVVTYELEGQFELRGMSQPKGSPPITGTFACLVVDPATGHWLDVSTGPTDYDLGLAGPVTVIFSRG